MDKPLMLVMKHTFKEWNDYMRSIAMSTGIPDSYHMVLRFLLRHPGSSQKDIAAFCNISTPAISQTVKEMQLTGYLRKEADDRDQRYFKLYLTEKGAACGREIRAKIQAADEVITQKITPEKEQEMIKTLKRLSEIIAKELPGC